MRVINFKFLFAGGLIISLLNTIPFSLYKKAIFNKNPADLILVLGGDIKREHAGIALAIDLNLPLIVSGGSNPEHAKWLINKSKIAPGQVKLDYRAEDTLSNFTSIIDELEDENIKHVFLVTSEDHISRAFAVGNIIAGSRGIKLSKISIPCNNQCINESYQKQIFDIIRAIFWVSTGKDPKNITKFDLNLLKGKQWEEFLLKAQKALIK